MCLPSRAWAHQLILSQALLNCNLWLSQDLLMIILRFSVLWEVLSVFTIDYKIKISKMMKCAFCQHLKLNWPNNSNSHVLTSISNNCTGKKIWINCHKTFLIKTEISEKLCIFLKVFCKLDGWLISKIWIIKNIISSWSKDIFMFKEAPLRNKKSNVIVDWKHHEVPINGV